MLTTRTKGISFALFLIRTFAFPFLKRNSKLALFVAANLHQSRTLATLRDTLLPKLLSGELQTTSTS